ncbi:MAG TPA: nuclear transport factor 2 family protein [Thermoleophilaceae bacterium]|nr:nuclear transport factor 2 family protein [Thermoleophilaceae bacterium]
MSAENVDLIKQVEAAFNRDDLDTMVSLLSPDAEWEIAESNPSARTLHGRDEIRPYLQDWRDTVQGLHYEASRYVDAGDAVVQLGTMTSRVGDGDSELTVPLAFVTRFRDGVAVRTEEYLDHDAALRAVGL